VTEHDVLKRKISELKARMRGQFGSLNLRYTENAIDELELRNEALEEECQRLRANLAAIPVQHIATLAELALRNQDNAVQLAGKVIAGWLYEWKAPQP